MCLACCTVLQYPQCSITKKAWVLCTAEAQPVIKLHPSCQCTIACYCKDQKSARSMPGAIPATDHLRSCSSSVKMHFHIITARFAQQWNTYNVRHHNNSTPNNMHIDTNTVTG